eukprot:NODE_1497_length_1145_cov_92.618613_g1219_i0.p1 GENE.NODE_1497_length_1145_cov_92.618613_g1219_i0~~NODE_1497_length_1145_cov_92.618613_g1219_i0.p1  ORF type:complete len:250 (-),score=53.53 NODE_1497_length_1145_cov_92.618613_g1219_i0:56-805(-)
MANAFNATDPPKRVAFLEAWLIVRHDELWAVEPYMPKELFKKYNNNYGYVSIDERNTPQAFTHWTYSYTHGKMMVVDIQGVGDMYTDPQIHTADGQGFGIGNIGQEGIDRFLDTHHCNPVCRALGLQRSSMVPKDGGTVVGARRRPEFKDDFRASLYCEKIVPIKGSASAEDLAIFGLSIDQFDSIAEKFADFADASGRIARQDLLALLQHLGWRMTQSELQGMMQHFGSGDSPVDFAEFLTWWTGLPQ